MATSQHPYVGPKCMLEKLTEPFPLLLNLSWRSNLCVTYQFTNIGKSVAAIPAAIYSLRSYLYAKNNFLGSLNS